MNGMPHPELALALRAARKTGSADRTESFGDQHARDNRVEAQLALDEIEKLLAFRVSAEREPAV